MAANTTPSGPSQIETSKPEIITRKIFRSFHTGFGDADDIDYTKRMDEYRAIQEVTSRYNRVHGSLDARWPGQLRAGLEIRKLSTQSHDLVPVYAVSWVDVVNNIYPATYYLVGKKIMKIRFGTVSEVGSDALTSNATGGMFDDDGSGVPYLYGCFGGVAGNTTLRRMNVAGTVSTTKSGGGAGDVIAALLLSLNGDAYRTITPTGGTANCQVSKCPYGNDRMDSTKWGQGVTVGFAGTSINVLTGVRNAPVAIKPEGIFGYNQALDRWINYTSSWRNFMHLNNGIGAFFLGDTLIAPMGDGGAFIFDGNNARPFDPGGLSATPNLHTTRDKFIATAALRHWLVGATKLCTKAIFAGTTLRFFTKISAAFTDLSTGVRDADLTTPAGTFTIGAGDKIYIGHTRPFTSVRFDTGAANTNAATITVKVSDGAGGFITITNRNFTALAGAALGQSGEIVMTQDPVIAGWLPDTVNSVAGLYWVELSFSGALTAISWLNCVISPWYPSIDPTNFPLDGLDKSGVLPHLLFGRMESSQNPIWHDLFSLPEPDDIGAVIFADAGGTSLNHSRTLLVIGRFCVWQIMVADNDRPGTEPSPFVNGYGLIEGSSFVPAAEGPIEGRLVRLIAVRIAGHEFDATMPLRFYYSWDWGKPWSRIGPTLTHAPGKLNVPRRGDDFGHRFRWAIGFKQSAAGLLGSQPTVTEIEVDFEVLPRQLDEQQERAMSARPRN